jgi:2-polyprenyl-3-methyl-5-hydroxy-6-metoxy-1,4-benzoquinol methylase
MMPRPAVSQADLEHRLRTSFPMNSPEPAYAIPDLGPEFYARWRASQIGATTERLERELILELAGDVGGRTVLDVGCGDGDLALALTNRGAIVTGIDASTAMIDAAECRAKQHGVDVAFQVGAASLFGRTVSTS